MTIKSRRHVLKGVGLALPAIWARPVVEAVVLPAHAQTSTRACRVEAGCYYSTDIQRYFFWPGGMGQVEVELFGFEDCSGPIQGMDDVVVAENAAAARRVLGCDFVGPIVTEPALSACNFWFCND